MSVIAKIIKVHCPLCGYSIFHKIPKIKHSSVYYSIVTCLNPDCDHEFMHEHVDESQMETVTVEDEELKND